MSKELQVHVGDTFDAMSRRVADAWHRAERGALTGDNAERHVGFQSFELFARMMTPGRLALLRQVHRQPVRSVRALAQALGRDEAGVQDDVDALVGVGLLDRDAGGLHADYDAISMATRIAL